MTPRENMLRAMRFEGPAWIPVRFGFNASCFHHYGAEIIRDLQAEHPLLFPGVDSSRPPPTPSPPPWARAGEAYRDPWGRVWETTDDGITGTVVEHPLAEWSALPAWHPPDPEMTTGRLPPGSVDWSELARGLERARAKGTQPAQCALEHGHTFLRYCDLRGYENALLDMADGEPRAEEVLALIEGFNAHLVKRYLELGAEVIGYPEDLGTQAGPLLSPSLFRAYIKPIYQRLMQPARERGCLVHMHCDGDLRALAEDLLDCGVDVLNPQDLVNGIDWLRDRLKGRVCIDLDVDRQHIVPGGSPTDIDELIREEVAKLSRPDGGLMFKVDIYPGIPLENLRALMTSLERHAMEGTPAKAL